MAVLLLKKDNWIKNKKTRSPFLTEYPSSGWNEVQQQFSKNIRWLIKERSFLHSQKRTLWGTTQLSQQSRMTSDIAAIVIVLLWSNWLWQKAGGNIECVYFLSVDMFSNPENGLLYCQHHHLVYVFFVRCQQSKSNRHSFRFAYLIRGEPTFGSSLKQDDSWLPTVGNWKPVW